MNREEIIEHLGEYLQNKIDNGEHKIFYNDLFHDEKVIDVINALEDLKEERDKYKEVLDKIKKELEEPDIYGVDEDGYDDAYYDKIYVRRIEELLEEIE